MYSYGFLWLPMAPRPHGFLWPHLGHETPYLIHMGQLWPLGTPWPRLAFSLVQIDQIASICPSLSLTGPRFVLMGPDWPRLAQIGPYGPSWSKLGLIGPKWPRLAPNWPWLALIGQILALIFNQIGPHLLRIGLHRTQLG